MKIWCRLGHYLWEFFYNADLIYLLFNDQLDAQLFFVYVYFS